MELINNTRYPAGITRMVYGEDRIAAAVLVRVTYTIRDGALVPSDGQPWLVSSEPWLSPQGPMTADMAFYRGGVDVFLFANAEPSGGRPTADMTIQLDIGASFRRRVRAFGPRFWQRRWGRLVPTTPQEYTSLPLTVEHAFGGKDSWDGLGVPYPENPDGTGFYLTEENAVDRPLPRIEDPEHLIERWDDRPAPAGLRPCPPSSPLRAKNGTIVRPDGRLKIRPHFFNDAFPAMIAGRLEPGDRVEATGVSTSGALRFALPRHPLTVRLGFGSESHRFPLAIDQVGIEVAEGRVFIAYRYPFRYIIHELQRRSCELLEEAS